MNDEVLLKQKRHLPSSLVPSRSYSVRWLRAHFRWSQFYKIYVSDLPLVHDATTQAVGLLILVCLLSITALEDTISTLP